MPESWFFARWRHHRETGCCLFRKAEKGGIEQGILRTLTGLVREGLLTVRDAAAHANMSEDAFERELKKMD